MQDAASILRQKKIRITEGRTRLLDFIRSQRKANTVQTLHEHVGGDLVTVYRNVELFAGAGLVKEIRLAGTSTCYEDASLSHHHHIICRECGKIGELPTCTISNHDTKTDPVLGFDRITEHVLEYVGICGACAR